MTDIWEWHVILQVKQTGSMSPYHMSYYPMAKHTHGTQLMVYYCCFEKCDLRINQNLLKNTGKSFSHVLYLQQRTQGIFESCGSLLHLVVNFTLYFISKYSSSSQTINVPQTTIIYIYLSLEESDLLFDSRPSQTSMNTPTPKQNPPS